MAAMARDEKLIRDNLLRREQIAFKLEGGATLG